MMLEVGRVVTSGKALIGREQKEAKVLQMFYGLIWVESHVDIP